MWGGEEAGLGHRRLELEILDLFVQAGGVGGGDGCLHSFSLCRAVRKLCFEEGREGEEAEPKWALKNDGGRSEGVGMRNLVYLVKY